MSTTITTAANLGIAPITVPDGMPHDELLDAMYQYAAEADAQIAPWFHGGGFTVRAWPNDRFDPREVVEYRHTRQHYSPETVRALIAEDAGVTGNPLASLHGVAR
jgi:uroporphyrinogen-III synthase